MRFNITFDTYTPESIALGDAAARGFHVENVTLRDAFSELRRLGFATPTGAACGNRNGAIRWLDFEADADYRTGEQTTYSLHFPADMSPASAQRIARLMGCDYCKR